MIRAGDYDFEIVNGKPFARGVVSKELSREVIPLIELVESINREPIKESSVEAIKEVIKYIPSTRINVNHANEKVLDLLPGVGEVTAKRIVESREENLFVDFADLQERIEGTLKPEVADLIEF